MFKTPAVPTQYHPAGICWMSGNAVGLIAARKGDGPLQVFFWRSENEGQTWSQAYPVGTMTTGTLVNVNTMLLNGSGDLKADNGIDFVQVSTNGGRKWDPA